MPESLYDRYMAADNAHRAHDDQCTTCSSTTRCEAGQRLYESLSRLQDANPQRGMAYPTCRRPLPYPG